MQIMIDIPDEMYQELQERQYEINKRIKPTLESVVLKGTPLPKNHGRLIDADALKKSYKSGNWDLHKVLYGAETIIGAENEEDEEQKYDWMYSIFNKDKIMAQKEQWNKEAEEAGMTLIEYLESINPLKQEPCETPHYNYCSNCGAKMESEVK